MTTQYLLEPEIQMQTKLIRSSKGAQSLFEDYTKLKAVSYVVSPLELLKLIENGFESVEVIVGENLTKQYKQELSKENNSIDIIKQLVGFIEQEKLKLYMPKRTIHSKLFLLENDKTIRAINGSANLTSTALKGNQINYCWYKDYPKNDKNKELNQILKDFNEHKKYCSLFMDDLIELMKQKGPIEIDNVVELWLQGSEKTTQTEIREAISDITDKAMEITEEKESESIFQISLKPSIGRSNPIKKYLKSFITNDCNINNSENMLLIDRKKYLDHKQHMVPLLKVDIENERVLIGLGSKLVNRTTKPTEINKRSIWIALKHIEDYINTVDKGVTNTPKEIKASMYETILYILSSPFFNDYLINKRNKVGKTDKRGPRFLYIYGPSYSGKSTLIRFSLNLLAGMNIESIRGDEFNKKNVEAVSYLGTSFPLIFDDIPSVHHTSRETLLKSYWEVNWDYKHAFPQIILTSNTPFLKDWAVTRMKRIDINIHFPDNKEMKEQLNNLFSKGNDIFKWFSLLYIKHLKENDNFEFDELHIARKVMRKLYKMSGKKIPSYFPIKPVEEIYDVGKKEWNRLIHDLHKAKIRDEGSNIYVEFTEDMTHADIKPYVSYLPQNVKSSMKGKQLNIENPEIFRGWLNLTAPLKPINDTDNKSLDIQKNNKVILSDHISDNTYHNRNEKRQIPWYTKVKKYVANVFG